MVGMVLAEILQVIGTRKEASRDYPRNYSLNFLYLCFAICYKTPYEG